MLGRRTGSSPSERAAFLPAGRRALSLEAGFQPDPASSTLDNIADLLTKALDPTPFEKLRRLLLNVLAVGAIYPVPRARRIAAKRAV